ncbi:MAG: hypothetical protein AAFX79_13640 [Planctomycetota bacterium]
MTPFTENRAEALLELQTRRIPLPGGGTRELAYTVLVWRALDYLVDRGYFTAEELVELADVDGWEPPNVPFEMRFATAIAYWTKRCNATCRDYTDYCRGRI